MIRLPTAHPFLKSELVTVAAKLKDSVRPPAATISASFYTELFRRMWPCSCVGLDVVPRWTRSVQWTHSVFALCTAHTKLLVNHSSVCWRGSRRGPQWLSNCRRKCLNARRCFFQVRKGTLTNQWPWISTPSPLKHVEGGRRMGEGGSGAGKLGGALTRAAESQISGLGPGYKIFWTEFSRQGPTGTWKPEEERIAPLRLS